MAKTTTPVTQQAKQDEASNKNYIPTYADLCIDEADLETSYRHDKLNILLAQPPRDAWVKKHPMIKVKNERGESVPEEYMKGSTLRNLLLKVFTRYRDEILREGLMLNSAYVVVRLHYWNPALGDWDFKDGVGAVDIQTAKDCAPSDLKMIVAAAVQKALPSAAEYAFKNACKKLGRLFGGELNKNCTYEFTSTFKAKTENTQQPAAIGGSAPAASATTSKSEELNF